LIASFLERGYQVMIETSGERDISVLDRASSALSDLQMPRKRESARNRWSNLETSDAARRVEVVLADRHDYEWARAALQTHRLNQRVNAV